MFPSIPQNTSRAARAMYGKGNLYLQLGDHLNTLVSNLNPELLAMKLDGNPTTFLAVLTIVQYVEELTDLELARSIQRRIDLRYALHLPIPGPRFNPISLCTFRCKVLTDPQYQSLFEEMFKNLYPEIGPDKLSTGPDTTCVVKTICANTIRASVIKAMFRCIEALSANHFHWLRQIALPYWYERYSHSMVTTGSGISIRQKELTLEDLSGDIQHLLQEAGQSRSQEINEIQEIKELRHIWGQMSRYESDIQCTYCLNNHMERRQIFGQTDQIQTLAQS
ncbi:MAG: transposase [Anaerolineales bacterium]